MGEEKYNKTDKGEAPLKEDFSGLIMKKIKKKDVKMKRAYVFFLEKLGLESALVFFIIFSAFIISVIFNFLDSTKLLEFSSLGMPGLKIIFLTIPYGFIALLIAALFLSIYLAKKLDIPCRKNITCNRIFVYFLLVSFLIGIFFIISGVHKTIGNWSISKMPCDASVYGKVRKITPQEVTVESEEGDLVELVFDNDELASEKEKCVAGKFLRAVGKKDANSGILLHAQKMLCCDGE